jgi:hypothetical protein
MVLMLAHDVARSWRMSGTRHGRGETINIFNSAIVWYYLYLKQTLLTLHSSTSGCGMEFRIQPLPSGDSVSPVRSLPGNTGHTSNSRSFEQHEADGCNPRDFVRVRLRVRERIVKEAMRGGINILTTGTEGWEQTLSALSIEDARTAQPGMADMFLEDTRPRQHMAGAVSHNAELYL